MMGVNRSRPTSVAYTLARTPTPAEHFVALGEGGDDLVVVGAGVE